VEAHGSVPAPRVQVEEDLVPQFPGGIVEEPDGQVDARSPPLVDHDGQPVRVATEQVIGVRPGRQVLGVGVDRVHGGLYPLLLRQETGRAGSRRFHGCSFKDYRGCDRRLIQRSATRRVLLGRRGIAVGPRTRRPTLGQPGSGQRSRCPGRDGRGRSLRRWSRWPRAGQLPPAAREAAKLRTGCRGCSCSRTARAREPGSDRCRAGQPGRWGGVNEGHVEVAVGVVVDGDADQVAVKDLVADALGPGDLGRATV